VRKLLCVEIKKLNR